jgi:chromosome segregation ATPase
MVLVANRDVADVKDEDGNTALDLAKEGEYAERDAVIAALKRWLDNGSTSKKSPSKSTGLSPAMSMLKSIFNDEKKEEVATPRTVGRLQKEISDLKEGKSNMDFDWSQRYSVQETAYTDRIRMLEAQIDSMINESKYDKLNIRELQTQLAMKDAELESKSKQLTKACDERDGLRQTLADLTEQHDRFKNKSEILSDRLGSMNASLLTMMEQQNIVVAAMQSREEQWQTLSDMRREKLKELVALEEEDTCEEIELRGCLMKQTKEMAAIKAVIAAVRQQDVQL